MKGYIYIERSKQLQKTKYIVKDIMIVICDSGERNFLVQFLNQIKFEIKIKKCIRNKNKILCTIYDIRIRKVPQRE